ncbi:cation-translocating P-type ATPase [Methanohalophilus halophilus]|uniref:Ca2+-transporting ATPase n=1 Tax=Methanohalophilus halophilus TaxID=2177 RepID=A0A1L3Q1J8_9EURY|nr:cation-translocating P-type ATPase [Methanohalophilus halophilus]APH38661.1 cation transporter [Methanohalophilus halophilus]RNI08339.1 cation-translocating P-type ATPase [Methanohalophilus halophilus]SDW18847.1 Ca2+-transporting ATPase [Methanohalophilus halophilus]
MKLSEQGCMQLPGDIADSEGLGGAEVSAKLQKEGYNELEETEKTTPLKIFIGQLGNVIVWVLAAAALISLYIDEVVNFWVIFGLIIFVILLGFVQEYRAEKAMESLKGIVRPKTTVLREGTLRQVATREIVTGDILVLEAGDSIPADACVFELQELKVDESALTGESLPVEKNLQEPLYAATQVVRGKCRAVVMATGMDTELGSIASLIQPEKEITPLQREISAFSKKLAVVALLASGMALGLGIFAGAPVEEMLIIALALAVAAVPEGLPLTLTITLAYGMRRMAAKNAIIRKMLAVETLGSTSVICTDKTGTLTRNEMTVEKIWTMEGLFEVTGSGYGSEGEFMLDGKSINPRDSTLGLLLKGATLCNNASLNQKEHSEDVVGDPTELALLAAASKAGIRKEELAGDYERLHEILFNSDRKMMTTVHRQNQGSISFTKGAVEVVLERCGHILKDNERVQLDQNTRNTILEENSRLASGAYRVIAIARKDAGEKWDETDLEEGMTFLGLMAMTDPIREGVTDAIGLCHQAGIKVVMITGDNVKTALAISGKLGIPVEQPDNISDPDGILADGAITGDELAGLSDETFAEIADHIHVYARVMPEQKLRIVKALQAEGHVVAMTGDGVNDAPALKKADIGVSMGLKGTDVARQSSDMVLQDDNFATIVEAIKRGRTIYDNIEKFTSYLVSRNFNEIILIMLGISLLGYELVPLLALQILFINMFGEIMPSIALGLDPAREEVMHRRPRPVGEGILAGRKLVLVGSVAGVMGLACFTSFLLADPIADLERARTIAFATVVSMILFVPFAFRSLEVSVLQTGFRNKLIVAGVLSTLLLTLVVMYVPFLAAVFDLQPLGLRDWLLPLGFAAVTLGFVEIVKGLLFRKNYR